MLSYGKVKEALSRGDTTEGGRDLLFPQGRSGKWQEIKSSPYYKEMLEEVLTEGVKYLKSPIRSIPYSVYKVFDTNGSRKEYETEYFERRARLCTFAILSLAYGEKKYIEALQDTIWAICDEFTWCLPAHYSGKSLSVLGGCREGIRENGNIIPELREHKKWIDLFSAETGFALAEVTSLLEEQLEPLVVFRARKEVKERILESYCELNTSFDWETCTNNWAAVCAGSIGIAAIYLIDDDSVLAPIVHRLLGVIESYLNGFEEDGACTEGLGYWNYGFGFFTYFADLLKQRTGGKIDLFNNEKVRNIATFQQKCYLSKNKVVSFSDGDCTINYSIGLTHYLKAIYSEVEIPDRKYRSSYNDDHCYRWGILVRDFVWSHAEYQDSGLEQATYYLRDAQWFITRKLRNEGIVAFAAKGGHNDEPHNHNDLGSFILHINGDTLLTDTGCGEYTKQYFGPERYSIFCNSSRSHSVPIIEGEYQSVGREFTAAIVKAESAGDRDELIIDATKAYKNENLKAFIRSFRLSNTAEFRLELRDSFEFTRQPASVTERFVTFYKPQVLKDGTVKVVGDRSSVEIFYNPEQLKCIIGREVFVNHKTQPEDVYTIDLGLIQPGEKVDIEVGFQGKFENI